MDGKNIFKIALGIHAQWFISYIRFYSKALRY